MSKFVVDAKARCVISLSNGEKIVPLGESLNRPVKEKMLNLEKRVDDNGFNKI